MDDDKKDGSAVNYGGTISDVAGRPTGETKAGGKDGAAPVAEQLGRIMPQKGG